MLGSAVHNNVGALFLLLAVAIPLGKIIFGSVSGKFDNPEKPKPVKSGEYPKRDSRDERAGFVENKIERFKRGSLR